MTRLSRNLSYAALMKRFPTFLMATSLALSLLFAACANSNPAKPPATATVATPVNTPTAVIAASPNDSPNQLPQYDSPQADDASTLHVSSANPSLGDPHALVTMVVFLDLQCPFSARLFSTLGILRQRYRSDALRFVYKHNPLPFHLNARRAAELSMAVYQASSSEGFRCFITDSFSNQRSLDDDSLRATASRCGIPDSALNHALNSSRPSQQVDQDIELAREIKSQGTPDSYINGIHVSGAQPIEKITEIIDNELAESRRSLSTGANPANMHAYRVAHNFTKDAPRPTPAPTPPAQEDKTVYRVPVAGSPVRGPANALVTLVIFSDFQCPFCQRAYTTLEQLRHDYPTNLRFVFKNNPLPFHPMAEPAAQLTLEARAKGGDPAFWRAHDALFATQGSKLDDAALDAVAQTLHLNLSVLHTAMQNHKYKTTIDTDKALASQLGANGTPTFYINGRRLTGAQPIEKFKALIDESLRDAQGRVQHGTPASRVYDVIMQSGLVRAAED